MQKFYIGGISMRDMYRKMHLANVVGKYVNGNMKRRDFLKNAGMLGLELVAWAQWEL